MLSKKWVHELPRRRQFKRAAALNSARLAMISDLDIWRAANLLIRRGEADAELIAGRVAELMLDLGDPEGQLVWMRIRCAISEMQASMTGPAH